MAWNEPGGGGNQHDPWSSGGRRNGGGGGGGNNQGPPDLDEALKKFQDKLNRMLGTRRGKRGGGGQAGKTGHDVLSSEQAGLRRPGPARSSSRSVRTGSSPTVISVEYRG